MEQTNRTILFGEINAEQESLLTLISEEEKRRGLNDQELFRIHEKLEVKSYKEFLSKFKPSVNMFLDTEKCIVSFSKDESTHKGQKVMLDKEGTLLNALIKLMDARRQRKYVLTCFGDMLQNFIPIRGIDSFREKRDIILAEFEKEHIDKAYVKKEMIHLMEQYDDGIFLLNVFLQDVHDFCCDKSVTNIKDKGIKDDRGRMQIKVIKKAERYKNLGYIQEATQAQIYKEVVSECIGEARNGGVYKHISLYAACMMLPVLYAQKDLYNIQKQYETYFKLYTDIIKKFWITAKPIIETVLGVREFFEQYQNLEGMQPCLIVANFKISELIQPKNKELLELYLNTVNTKIYHQNTIWYAIIPNVATEDKSRSHMVRERFLTNREQYNYEHNEVEEVIMLLESLAKYKIQSFLSMSLTQEHTFSALARNGIKDINDSLRLFEKMNGKDYCIPCFPNFTLISKDDGYQSVGQIFVYDDLSEKIQEDGEKIIWLDELGIEASYVAAGLVAACQCPKYLKKCFGTGINEELPGVAYRFSENTNYMKTTIEMLSNTIELTEEVEAELVNGSRGILFGQKKGKTVVLTDRVFSYSGDNKLLISMIQTMNYIERQIQYETQDFKKNLIHQFFQKRPGSAISQWRKVNAGMINMILREDEELEYKIDEVDDSCTFHVRFMNDELVKTDTVSTFKE